MAYKYKIIQVTPEQHSIVVRYYTDSLTEELLCVHRDEDGEPIRNEDGMIERCRYDLNITLFKTAGSLPTGEALKERIVGCAPHVHMELEEKINDPSVDTSLSALVDLIGQEVVFEPPEVPELSS
jgi:hypothetical protein